MLRISRTNGKMSNSKTSFNPSNTVGGFFCHICHCSVGWVLTALEKNSQVRPPTSKATPTTAALTSMWQPLHRAVPSKVNPSDKVQTDQSQIFSPAQALTGNPLGPGSPGSPSFPCGVCRPRGHKEVQYQDTTLRQMANVLSWPNLKKTGGF